MRLAWALSIKDSSRDTTPPARTISVSVFSTVSHPEKVSLCSRTTDRTLGVLFFSVTTDPVPEMTTSSPMPGNTPPAQLAISNQSPATPAFHVLVSAWLALVKNNAVKHVTANERHRAGEADARWRIMDTCFQSAHHVTNCFVPFWKVLPFPPAHMHRRWETWWPESPSGTTHPVA